MPPGYLRADGRKGIRNIVAVAYLVECAHHVARRIVQPYADQGAQLIGFPGCYPNDHAHRIMEQICTHPNVGAVLLVSLGCESFSRQALFETIEASGRPLRTLVIQESGGTLKSIETGRAWVEQAMETIKTVERVPFAPADLIVGSICGGSDATSGIAANPAIGLVSDRLVAEGGTSIFEETGELIGCEQHMAGRAVTPALGRELVASVEKAKRYHEIMQHGSFAPGNAEGELTTQEEKSLGAYCKSGSGPIHGLLKPGDRPPRSGLYLLDVVPDGEVRFGFPNINDNAEITELIACGAHLILFATGRGSVVGSAISPVIKITGNTETFFRMRDDMDINAGAFILGDASLEAIRDEIFDRMLAVIEGEMTCSEALGHQEFALVYKSFEPLGPSCLPGG
ncbi:MAG: UxaA family hydrolase [Verrucomicrobiota bacterium]